MENKVITLVAILATDKHKCCEHFKEGDKIVWPVCKDYANECVANMHRKLLDFFVSKKESINVDVNSFLKIIKPEYHQSLVSSFYCINAFVSEKYSLKTNKVKSDIYHHFIVDQHKYGNLVHTAQVISEAETIARKLMVTPGNYLTAKKFTDFFANKLKGNKKLKFSVLTKKELEKKKMGLILAVGNASNEEQAPRILVAEYINAPNKPKVALVGKGIVFDTGGLNLKPGEAMTGMHGDMSGAAIVLATIYALSKLNVKTNVVVVAPLASNEIGPNSYRVNDVLTSYSGKTVEILNTDAEGRLILADAISYAKKDLHADTIVTVATLTGAILIALGEVFTGVWASSNQLWDSFASAATYGSELAWRMPFFYEFHNEVIENTKIADIANLGKGRLAGSITAAEFLKFFAGDTNFIHADIAGSNNYHKEFIAVMVRTLFNFAKDVK